MKINKGDILELKMVITVEVTSHEYEDTDAVIQELEENSYYEILGTENINIEWTSWEKTEFIKIIK